MGINKKVYININQQCKTFNYKKRGENRNIYHDFSNQFNLQIIRKMRSVEREKQKERRVTFLNFKLGR